MTDHQVACLRHRHERAQNIGVPLARHEVSHARQQGFGAARDIERRQIRAKVHDAGLARSVRARQLRDPGAVGQDQRGGAISAPHRFGAARDARNGPEDVAAVHRNDQRQAELAAASGVPGRHRVVRVHEIELALPTHRPSQRGRGPRAPPRVAPWTRRRRVTDVAHLQTVEGHAGRLVKLGSERPPATSADAVQYEHDEFGPGCACRERLSVGPDAEHGVVVARVVLGDDGYAHRR